MEPLAHLGADRVTALIVPDYMPGNAGVRMIVFATLWSALIHGLYWCFVRTCPRTQVLLTARENFRMQAVATPHGTVGFCLFLFSALFAFVVWQSFYAAPDKRWGSVVGAVAIVAFAWGFVRTIRIGLLKRRMDREPSTQPGLWMRRRAP